MPLIIIKDVIFEEQLVTIEMGLRLSKYFGLSEKFWLNLQLKYDLEVTKDKLDQAINSEVKTMKI